VYGAKIAPALVIAVLAAGCGGHSAVERAVLRAFAKDRDWRGAKDVSCERHTSKQIKVAGRTYTAYGCTIQGGRLDGATQAVFWDGHHATSVAADCR
jgi:hypothetical protein